MLRTLWQHIAGGTASYFVALRISASAALPDTFSLDDVRDPAPIIRTDPSQMRDDDFDPRELLTGSSGQAHVLVLEEGRVGALPRQPHTARSLN